MTLFFGENEPVTAVDGLPFFGDPSVFLFDGELILKLRFYLIFIKSFILFRF
jgi:hypothetical protein